MAQATARRGPTAAATPRPSIEQTYCGLSRRHPVDAVDMKAAQALRLTIPLSIYARVEAVIE